MKTFKITTYSVIIFFVICTIIITKYRNFNELPERAYIAHAGGAIEGKIYTNSLEAINKSISKGIKHIELDFALTSDSVLVAVHEWKQFREMCGFNDCDSALSYSKFKSAKIYGKYQPVDAKMADSIFNQHKDLVLVTDKIDDIEIYKSNFPDLAGRLLVECFSDSAYKKVKESGFATPMRTGFKTFYNSNLNNFTCYYTMGEKTYKGVSKSISYKILTRVFNYPIAVFILGDSSNSTRANEILESDKFVRLVYIDEF